MRRSVIVSALAASVSMAAWGGSASAQSVGIYVGPPAYDSYYYDDYRDYRSGPRVYGYSYERSGRHLRQPEDYRTGSKRWWKQMDRQGRGGHQD
jgi:hypothetical protein